MKAYLKKILIVGISLFILVFSPGVVSAQPDPCNDPVDNPCPIDSGVLILIAIGAGYGIKKVVASKKVQIIK